jgi:uncharacterized coiled-coil protein SlyX
MTPAEITPWASLAALLISIGGSLYVWLSKPGRQALENVEKVDERLGKKVEALEERVAKCEAEIEHLPDKDATHRLELGMAELKGQMQVLSERLQPVAAISNRMQELMLERGR